jgi:endo-1,4-beta-xylanase
MKTRSAAVVLCFSAAAWSGADGEEPALKRLAPGFRIGAAINQAQGDGADPVAAAIVARHFDTITNENLLKWEGVHPEPNRYDFEPADSYVAFGEKHGMFVVGHTLVWHQQTPGWVFAGPDGGRVDRETLLARMREHIQAVVGRYRGRIHGWDVVNEALDEDGTLRRTPWLEIIGEDYVAKAFEYAHAADPQAELYYNDYNLWKGAKRAGALRIVRELRERGLRVDGVGEQGHWLIDGPSLAEIEATLVEIGAAGFKALISELDVDPLPRRDEMYGADLDLRTKLRAETDLYRDGLPPEVQERLARRYAEIFVLFLKHRDTLARVTFWGVTDAQSWLNNFPVPGRTNHPLLWDRAGRPKPAFDAVVRVLRSGGGTRP